jgi:ribosome recycling factor
MQHVNGETRRVMVTMTTEERRALVEAAARRSVAEQRPVSVSEVAREALRRGLEPERGEAP